VEVRSSNSVISHTSRAEHKRVRYPQSAAMAAQQQYVCSPVVTNPQKIVLIVDDNPNDRFLLRHAFEKAELPCKVVEAADGQEAINYLAGEPPYSDRMRYPLPDLVVLDLHMPNLNGFEVLEWLRARVELHHFHVAVLSSSSHQEDHEQVRALGAHDYHVKPSDMTSWTRLAQHLRLKWLNGLVAPAAAAR
jgi:CheY-like chemotaxis protein